MMYEDPTDTSAASGIAAARAAGPNLEAQQVFDRVFSELFGGPAVASGRYEVKRKLGAGGMGIVYEAYDPVLDCTVALKQLRPGLARSQTIERLRLEARAMAKLRTEPHVVTLYDFFASGGLVFVVMQHVDGMTLRGWQRRDRSWREILGMYLQAGAGLAAAHRAGLVHSDFKPDNVMIDGGGIAKVTDFGLVAASAAGAEGQPAESPELHGGTPRYMSPEQCRGEQLDGRSDQFSFCVALYEALCGQHPFWAGREVEDTLASPGDRATLRPYIEATLSGELRPPPAGANVPAHVVRALTRGLSKRAGQRFPSMVELLTALADDPTRRRTWGIAAIGLVLGVGGVFGWNHLETVRRIDACRATGGEIAEVWNDTTRASVRVSMLATGLPFADTSHSSAAGYLDRYAQEWATRRRDLCLQATVEEVLDPRTYALATACLAERRDALASLVDVLTTSDPSVVSRAVPASSELSRVDACADAVSLGRRPPLPEEPRLRPRAQELRRGLDRARILQLAGKYAEAHESAEQILAEAEELAYPPLLVEARATAGMLAAKAERHERAEELLVRAYEETASSGHEELAADVAIEIVGTIGYGRQGFTDALVWAKSAQWLLRSLGQENTLREAKLFNQLGAVHLYRNAYAEARASFERALAIRRAVLDEGHPMLALSMNGLGDAHHFLGDIDEALALHERALAIQRAALGAGHPALGATWNAIGGAHQARGEYRAALVALSQALTNRENNFGPESALLGPVLNNIAISHGGLGEYDKALAAHQRALAIKRRALAPDDLSIADSLGNLAELYRSRGEFDQSLQLERQALAIREAKLGPDGSDVARSLINIGNALTLQGDPGRAMPSLERALAIMEAQHDPERPLARNCVWSVALAHSRLGDHEKAAEMYARAIAIAEETPGAENSELATLLMGLGSSELERGRSVEAISALERALALRAHHDEPSGDLADVRFALARALWEAPAGTGRDRPRSLVLATQAREAFRALDGAAAQQMHAAIEVWLKRHRT